MLPHRILDYKTFKQLYVLLQGKADTLGEAAICITEKILEQTESSWNYWRSRNEDTNTGTGINWRSLKA